MELLALPEDIMGYIITQFLDIKSIATLYNTGNMQLRQLIVTYIRKCSISRSNVATIKFLETNFYKDISGHIQELDMAMIPNFEMEKFKAAVMNLRKVKFLNLSYTNITLADIATTIDPSIHWPELKDIYVNFGNYSSTRYTDSDIPNILTMTQNFVQQLENIHLMTTLDELLYPKILFTVLEKAKLNSLQLTTPGIFNHTRYKEHKLLSPVPVFKQLHLRLLNWRHTKARFPSLKKFPILAMLDLKEYEFIIIFSPSLNSHTVFVSSIFVNFFAEHFDLNVCCISELDDVFNKDTVIPGNVAVMLWKKDANKFKDKFFRHLLRGIKEYFPYCPKGNETRLPNRYDWFVLTPMITDSKGTSENDCKEAFVLDYDTLFENKQQIQISFDLSDLAEIPVTLNSDSSYLSKLTYLSLCGLVRYNSDFFDILFRCCTLLNKLNVEAPERDPCWLALCKSLPLCSTLKNFRLVDRNIDMQSMYSALVQCRAIENIFIVENSLSLPHYDLDILYQQCPNLYNLLLQERTRNGNFNVKYEPEFSMCKSSGLVNVVRSSCPIMGLELFSYDPYISVFKLNPVTDIVYFRTESQ
ncbi:hypothetical protein K1T71_012845 [Dendrolimus kikuchii]|uniref:Uncharacterized protein n=1 Tax=Dendrolimus kikuchii TaxID=765133 RepID=A0ACC1CIE2_9NEOP|nr:hypothetical protein K1T71_012845 [Dendrolimus kikuchii]